MNKKVIAGAVFGALIIIAGAGAAPSPAFAHGCSGQGSCTQDDNSVSQTNGQGQDQRQSQASASAASARAGDNVVTTGPSSQTINGGSRVVNNHSGGNRYLSVRPVQVPATPAITPSADVSRMVGAECGPRQRIGRRDVHATDIRTFRENRKIENGYDEYVYPDFEMPYRRVEMVPGIVQLIGHRVVETTAALNNASSGGFSLTGGNNSGFGGGGAHGAAAIQRLVTTIRLHECVAYEIDTRPTAKIKG